MKRISDKKLAKLGGKYPFSTIASKPKRIRKRPRKPSETLRIYGGKKRIEFVKSLPCSACGVVGYSENAHVLGNGGMGRKGDYTGIAPLCGVRIWYAPFSKNYYIGCHALYDQHREEFAHRFPDFDPAKAAEATESAWLASHNKEKE